MTFIVTLSVERLTVRIVAGEVKNLANQTARATEEIQAQVSQMQAVTGSTAEAIRSITGTITTISAIATAIASEGRRPAPRARAAALLHEAEPQVGEQVAQEARFLLGEIAPRLLLEHRQQVDGLLDRQPEPVGLVTCPIVGRVLVQGVVVDVRVPGRHHLHPIGAGLAAGLGWLAAMASGGARILRYDQDGLLLAMQLFGFVLGVFSGVGLRTFPTLFGMPAPSRALWRWMMIWRKPWRSPMIWATRPSAIRAKMQLRL